MQSSFLKKIIGTGAIGILGLSGLVMSSSVVMAQVKNASTTLQQQTVMPAQTGYGNGNNGNCVGTTHTDQGNQKDHGKGSCAPGQPHGP